MEKLRLGMIGAGFISRFQAAAMEQVRNMELTAITSLGRAEEFAALAREKNLGPCEVYPTVTEMCKHVDAVAIYCPNYTRIEVMEEIVAAVKAGAQLKGLICEKPLGRNVAEARRLVELADSVQLKTAYFENQLQMKPVKALMKQLEPQQRTMGPLSLTRCSEEHGGPHEPWFWDPIQQGGGVLSDMACHSIAVGWHCLNPLGKSLTFMQPQTVSCDVGLLKWGLPEWRDKLLKQHGIDYAKTPAEDFCTGIITYKNPETGQIAKSQFTNSWMFEKQGLRLFMDGMGPGYAFEINSLVSPVNIFIGDAAAEAAANVELALEKSTASRGLLPVLYNEADIYGYTDENVEAANAFLAGRDAFLPLSYGLEITRLVMAAYLAAERKTTIDLTDPAIQNELESYVPAIQQGHGADVLFG